MQEVYGEKCDLFTLQGRVKADKKTAVGSLAGIVCLHEMYDNEFKVKSISES